MSFIVDTGQAEGLRRSTALQAAGIGALFGALVSGSGIVILLGFLLTVVAFIGGMRAVWCPRCGYNLSWYAAFKLDMGRRDAWLAELEACPKCGFCPEGEAPPQTVPELRPAEAPPAPVVLEPGPPSAPWRTPEPVLEKPAGSDYGYLEGDRLVACTRPELMRRFARGTVPQIVWVPGIERPTWFENVPELLARRREDWAASTRRGYWGPLGFLAAAAAGILAGGASLELGSGRSFFIAIAAILVGVRLRAAHAARRLDAAAIRRAREDGAHAAWLGTRKARLTQTLVWCMAGVYVAQALSSGDSARVAGMLPAAVARGEWWRLLSYGVMHAHVVHLWLNALALLSLGKLMEVHAHRALLPLVMLATIVTGGLVGYALGPGLPMVGASGGLLGLIGFLTVVGFRRRSRVPHGFAVAMLLDVAFVAAVGLVGFRFIANAGHLGGLLGGLALGALLVPRPNGEDRVGWRPGALVLAAGWACMGILVATCAATAAYLLAPH